MSRAGLAAAAVVVVLAGAFAALGPLGPEVVIDRDAEWREVCLGCRRPGGGNRALALPGLALLHFHGLAGRAGEMELTVSAPSLPAVLEVARLPEGPPALQARIGPATQEIRLAISSGERDLDVWLRANPAGGQPLLLHRAVLRRDLRTAGRLLQVLPFVVGLVVLGLLARREPVGIALALALAALACTVLAVQVLDDPVTLLEWKRESRHQTQIAFAALVAAAALWRIPSRRLACAALALVSALLFLPTAAHGLVSDDFLWARPWTLADVGSAFVGPEDPTGASNTYYRPLSTLSHATDAWIWRDRVAGYHLTNIALQAVLGAVALLLLERLGLSRRAALAGALAWSVHPMAASAVAWASQRTDLIASLFYLATLAVLLSPLGPRGWPPLLPALLAFGSKESAISLPAMATLVVWLALPAEEWRRRRGALAALWVLAIVYLVWWAYLFPDKVVARLFSAAAPAARAARDPVSGLGRGLADIYTQVFAPAGYERWWNRTAPLDLSRMAALGVAVILLLLAWWLTRRAAGWPWGAVALAGAWPALVSAPLFGLGLVDVYRLGLLSCFGLAVLAAAATHALETRDRRLVAVAALVVVGWLAPVALEAADEWGPGGFYYEMSLSLTRRGEDWLAVFAPRGRERFWAQHGAREHVLEAWKRVDRDPGESAAGER
jgi:hypothetical protein